MFISHDVEMFFLNCSVDVGDGGKINRLNFLCGMI